METATIFDRIVIAVPREKIYRRLGYRRDITVLSAMDRESVDDAIDYACSRLHLKGAGKRLSIKAQTPEQIILSEGTAFRSTALSRFIRWLPGDHSAWRHGGHTDSSMRNPR